jgi:hypothetical protein
MKQVQSATEHVLSAAGARLVPSCLFARFRGDISDPIPPSVKRPPVKKMLKKGLSGDPFEFKLDSLEDTIALEGRGAGYSFFDYVYEQLPIHKIVRLPRYKEAP